MDNAENSVDNFMSTKMQRKRRGKENLQRIIDLCRSLEEQGLDPFLLDVDNVLMIIHEYLPEWENLHELNLDAEAINQIASAIRLQSEWIKHRSTSLYTDPFLIEEKLRKLSKENIGSIFLESWHPIVEFEQISPHSLAEAIKYWQGLVPLDQRWLRSQVLQVDTGTATRDELLQQNIIAEKDFSQVLESFWHELKKKAAGKDRIEYWDFIGAEAYEETIRRAYLTSFLVTYGYATLEVDRLEEIVYIKPHETPLRITGNKQATSLPIPISLEDWESWKERVKN